MPLFEKSLRHSTRAMQIVGWSLSIGLVALLFIYPPGLLWGAHPEWFPHLGPAHPPSDLPALHPYIYMLGAMYMAYGFLLIRGAKKPRANAALFDYGILANLMHGAVMIPQSFFYTNEHAHLWADIPACFLAALCLWIWHPNRIPGQPKD